MTFCKKDHLRVIAIIIPSSRAWGLPAVTIKEYCYLHVEIDARRSTACTICTRRFPRRSEEIHSVTKVSPVQIKILRLIRLKRPERDLLVDIFDSKERRSKIHSALRETDMVDDKYWERHADMLQDKELSFTDQGSKGVLLHIVYETFLIGVNIVCSADF